MSTKSRAAAFIQIALKKHPEGLTLEELTEEVAELDDLPNYTKTSKKNAGKQIISDVVYALGLEEKLQIESYDFTKKNKEKNFLFEESVNWTYLQGKYFPQNGDSLTTYEQSVLNRYKKNPKTLNVNDATQIYVLIKQELINRPEGITFEALLNEITKVFSSTITALDSEKEKQEFLSTYVIAVMNFKNKPLKDKYYPDRIKPAMGMVAAFYPQFFDWEYKNNKYYLKGNVPSAEALKYDAEARTLAAQHVKNPEAEMTNWQYIRSSLVLNATAKHTKKRLEKGADQLKLDL